MWHFDSTSRVTSIEITSNLSSRVVIQWCGSFSRISASSSMYNNSSGFSVLCETTAAWWVIDKEAWYGAQRESYFVPLSHFFHGIEVLKYSKCGTTHNNKSVVIMMETFFGFVTHTIKSMLMTFPTTKSSITLSCTRRYHKSLLQLNKQSKTWSWIKRVLR